MAKKDTQGSRRSGVESVQGIFQGLTDLVERLGDLAEKGEQLKRTGEFTVGSHGQSGKDEDIKGVYGFSVKVGIGDQGAQEVDIQPFGNVHRNEDTGEPVIESVREPMVDLFNEEDHVLVVAEMPGIGKDEVCLNVTGDILILSAEKDDIQYYKEIKFPVEIVKENMVLAVKNGVVEIRLKK